MIKSAVFLISVFYITVATAQPATDSLKKVLGIEFDVSKKIDLLTELAATYSNSNPDSSFSYANNALELIKPLKYSIRIVKTELQTHRKKHFPENKY
jgi:hypothetical protein